MFRLTAENGMEIAFGFSHSKLDPTAAKAKAITLCHLSVADKRVTAFALCSVKDNFNKEKGRKIALSRALQESGLGREDRELVWYRYFSREMPNHLFEEVIDASYNNV
jgi:hypothetical protein